MKVLAIAAAVIAFTACSTQQSAEEQSSTELKEISLQLPAKSTLPAQIAAKLTDYKFSVEPSTTTTAVYGGCTATAADKIEKAGKYDEALKLDAKLKRGCSYTIKLSVGQQLGGDKPEYKIWYHGDKLVDTNVTVTKIAVQVDLKMHPDRVGEIPGPDVIVVASSDLDLEVSAKFEQPNPAVQSGGNLP